MSKFDKYWKWLNLWALIPAALCTMWSLVYIEQGLEWVARNGGQYVAPVVGGSWLIRMAYTDFIKSRVKIPSKGAKTETQNYLPHGKKVG